jgi:hypothetical protein
MGLAAGRSDASVECDCECVQKLLGIGGWPPTQPLRGAFEGLAIRPVRCAGHRDDDRRHRPGSWPIRGRRPVAGASEDLPQLSTTADTLDGQNAPLTSTPADALSATSTVLSVLEPATVVNQVLGVATGVSALDVPGILRKLTVLPQKVAAPDAHGAHQVAGELYNQFSPLVKMAAVVDLCWVSQILSVIPDPPGDTQIAALVASILANVDVIRLATLVGQIQEIAWTDIKGLVLLLHGGGQTRHSLAKYRAQPRGGRLVRHRCGCTWAWRQSVGTGRGLRHRCAGRRPHLDHRRTGGEAGTRRCLDGR